MPPSLIVKRGHYNPYWQIWEWEKVTGPDWLGCARSDPHRSQEEAPIAKRETRGLIVPGRFGFPVRLNIIDGLRPAERLAIDRELRRMPNV